MTLIRSYFEHLTTARWRQLSQLGVVQAWEIRCWIGKNGNHRVALRAIETALGDSGSIEPDSVVERLGSLSCRFFTDISSAELYARIDKELYSALEISSYDLQPDSVVEGVSPRHLHLIHQLGVLDSSLWTFKIIVPDQAAGEDTVKEAVLEAMAERPDMLVVDTVTVPVGLMGRAELRIRFYSSRPGEDLRENCSEIYAWLKYLQLPVHGWSLVSTSGQTGL